MRRLLAAALLGITVFTASVGAQKKGTAIEPAGSVEIVEAKEGEFSFRIKNASGRTIVVPPPKMVWENSEEVLNVIKDLAATLKLKPPVDDPESNEEFATRDFRYSFRIKSPVGTVVAVPPGDKQWKTRAEVVSVLHEAKVILQLATPVEVKDELKGGELLGIGGGIPSIGSQGIAGFKMPSNTPGFSSPSVGTPPGFGVPGPGKKGAKK